MKPFLISALFVLGVVVLIVSVIAFATRRPKSVEYDRLMHKHRMRGEW